ncbi:MFS transporter [Nocardia sp. BMG51109]|uniref:MFS transporter n=1 Tax=Nocardia sp. BMG51109 TaxID=1056816 RepID=UPI0004B18C31|nr:MFS transporter [Nocardia sp. BMG51109]
MSDIETLHADPAFAPFTRRQIGYTSVVAFLAWTLSVYDQITFGNLLPVIRDDFHWSSSTASYVATAVSAGSVVLALAVGPMIDRLGRRPALLLTTSGAAVSSGLAAVAVGPVSLVLARALSGFGSAEQSVNAAYLNEVYGPRRRGLLYGMVQAGWPVGVMLSAGLAALLEPVIGWRGVFAVALFPLLVMLVLRTRLRESPHFLKLRRLRELRSAGATAEAAALARDWGMEEPGAQRNTYAELFRGRLRRPTLCLALGFFVKLIADSQLTVLATTVLGDVKGVSVTSALWIVVVANLVALVGYLVLGHLGDRIGRRETVAAAQLLAGALTVYLLFGATGSTAVIVSYSLTLFFAQGAAAPLFTYLGEVFPTRVRGSGAALIGAVGPLGGIVGPLLYGGLQDLGWSATAAAGSGAMACAVAAVLILGAPRIRPGHAVEGSAR